MPNLIGRLPLTQLQKKKYEQERKVTNEERKRNKEENERKIENFKKKFNITGDLILANYTKEYIESMINKRINIGELDIFFPDNKDIDIDTFIDKIKILFKNIVTVISSYLSIIKDVDLANKILAYSEYLSLTKEDIQSLLQ